MGNREVNYPDILPQEQPPTHLSLSCNSRVKIDVHVYNNTTRNDINSWKVIQASSAHLTNIFETVNHPVLNKFMIPESILKTSLLTNFQIALKTRWQISVQWLSVFLYHELRNNAWKTFCIRFGHVIRRSSIKCYLSKWRYRIKRHKPQ